MREARCGRGHMYDSDIYSTCPYCNSKPAIEFNFGDDIGVTVGSVGVDSRPASFAVDDIGATIGYAPEISATIAVNADHYVEKADRPAVGWLVCTKGPNKGKDYRFHSGINTIGRSKDRDICIENDNAISAAQIQAKIAYDPKHNNYSLIAGDGENINYLNGKAVYQVMDLEAYDRIELGNSEFIFVPLCGDKFCWDE